MRVHPPLLRRGSQPDESIHLTPLCIPPVSKREVPVNLLLRSCRIFGDAPAAGEATPVAASRSVRTILHVFPQSPVLIIEMRYFIFQLLIKVSLIHFFQNLCQLITYK